MLPYSSKDHCLSCLPVDREKARSQFRFDEVIRSKSSHANTM